MHHVGSQVFKIGHSKAILVASKALFTKNGTKKIWIQILLVLHLIVFYN